MRGVYLLGVYTGDRLARLHTLRGSEATNVLHQPLQLLVINVPLYNTASLQPAAVSECPKGRPHIVTQVKLQVKHGQQHERRTSNRVCAISPGLRHTFNMHCLTNSSAA